MTQHKREAKGGRVVSVWTSDWSDAIFSMEERESRWSRVRSLMEKEGVDAIVVLPCSNNHNRGAGDSLYLTQMGENSEQVAVYFPLQGEVTVWASSTNEWPKSTWIEDTRLLERGAGGAAIVARMKQDGIAQNRIGIAGLDGGVYGHCRENEGEANWSSVELIRHAFPRADVVSATELIGEARFVKSDEELAFLRKAAEICDAVHDSVARVARPGVPERRVFAEMMYTHAALGGTATPMIGWQSGPRRGVRHRIEQPTFRVLCPGDLIVVEIDGRWGGYIAQIDSTFTIGPSHRETRDAFAVALDAFNRVVEKMKPGVTVRELMEVAARAGTPGTRSAFLGMHGRGTGEDGPLVIPGPLRSGTHELELQENSVMCVKPSAIIHGVRTPVRFGDNVVVTPSGGQRMSAREPGIVECII